MKRTYPNLAAFLRDNDITQESLAAELGIAPSYISMLVRGERQPSLPLALKISARTHVPVESLLTGNDDSKRVSA